MKAVLHILRPPSVDDNDMPPVYTRTLTDVTEIRLDAGVAQITILLITAGGSQMPYVDVVKLEVFP